MSKDLMYGILASSSILAIIFLMGLVVLTWS